MVALLANDIGRRIRELRKLRGLSQEELAERAGLTLESISRAERGRSEITISSLARVCDALGVRLPEFFDRTVVPRQRALKSSRAATHLLALVEDVPEAEVRRLVAIARLVLKPRAASAARRAD